MKALRVVDALRAHEVLQLRVADELGDRLLAEAARDPHDRLDLRREPEALGERQETPGAISSPSSPIIRSSSSCWAISPSQRRSRIGWACITKRSSSSAARTRSSQLARPRMRPGCRVSWEAIA